jgi:rubrerythrin
MERFVRRENIKHYQELLKRVKDEAERQRILKLLAEERQKAKDAGDKIEEELKRLISVGALLNVP